MDWVQLNTTVPRELVEPLTELLRRFAGHTVVVEEAGGFNPDEGEGPDPSAPVTLTAYFPNDRRATWRKARLETGLRLLSLIQPVPAFQERVLGPVEWEEGWKAHFPVLRLGKRIVIAPPWAELAVSLPDILVRLDPGMAFGTGHHPTTRRCLLALERHLRPGARVLDVGCGSGILGIVALLLGASQVQALDTQQAAVRATRQNARANGVGQRLRVHAGSLPQRGLGTFDLVLANISARALVTLAPHVREALVEGGQFLGSGLLEERYGDVVAALQREGLQLVEEFVDEDWVTFVCSLQQAVRNA